MEVIVGKKAGFCFGVSNVVSKAKETLDKYKKIYCLGELVHNRQVVEELENMGMITVHDIADVPDDEKVIFRAHGISKDIYQKAEERNIEIIDLTCPIVLSIHKKIEKYAEDGYVILIGEKEHSEVVASKSFAKQISVVETEDDIAQAIEELKKSGKNKLYIVAQTTFSLTKFDEIASKICNFSTNFECSVDKTICNATELRQNETTELSKQVDAMIIIGGKNSANTRKLYDISKENCKDVFFVQTKDDIDLDVHRFNKIGVMAGASTPDKIIQEIVDYLE